MQKLCQWATASMIARGEYEEFELGPTTVQHIKHVKKNLHVTYPMTFTR
jgi:hypothetical protein